MDFPLTSDDHAADWEPKIWVIVPASAAAQGTGMPVALTPWEDGTYLSHVVGKAVPLGDFRVAVIVGAAAGLVTTHVPDGVAIVFNPEWQDGIGTSLAAGLRFAREQERDTNVLVILPIDQPELDLGHLENLVNASIQQDACALSRQLSDTGEEWIGLPAVIPERLFSIVLTLHGNPDLPSVLSPQNCITVDAAVGGEGSVIGAAMGRAALPATETASEEEPLTADDYDRLLAEEEESLKDEPDLFDLPAA